MAGQPQAASLLELAERAERVSPAHCFEQRRTALWFPQPRHLLTGERTAALGGMQRGRTYSCHCYIPGNLEIPSPWVVASG
jgi:hypothetical protein